MSEEPYHPDGGINNVESLVGREIASYFASLLAAKDLVTALLCRNG